MKIRLSSKPHYSYLLIFCLLAFMVGCDGNGDGNGGPTGPSAGSNSETIPPAGGSLGYEDASVTIPPGALDDSTEIVVGIPESPPTFTEPANTEQVGATYEFGPSGTTFNLPVMVTFEYEDGDLGT